MLANFSMNAQTVNNCLNQDKEIVVFFVHMALKSVGRFRKVELAVAADKQQT